ENGTSAFAIREPELSVRPQISIHGHIVPCVRIIAHPFDRECSWNFSADLDTRVWTRHPRLTVPDLLATLDRGDRVEEIGIRIVGHLGLYVAEGDIRRLAIFVRAGVAVGG